MTADEILEELRVKMDCSFLSDLPSLTGEQREKMLCLIEELSQDAADPKERKELQQYLCGPARR